MSRENRVMIKLGKYFEADASGTLGVSVVLVFLVVLIAGASALV